MGSEENQFAPLGDGVNKLIFKRVGIVFILINLRLIFFAIELPVSELKLSKNHFKSIIPSLLSNC
jgi:hypothetical protein